MSIEDLGARVVGAFWGAIVALLFYPPKTKGEAIRRLIGPILIGTILSPILLYYVKWPLELDYFLASSGAISCLSWFLLPSIISGSKKAIDKFSTKAEE